MADAKQLFKFGFLLRCAQEGLTPEQTADRIANAKQQQAPVADPAEEAISSSKAATRKIAAEGEKSWLDVLGDFPRAVHTGLGTAGGYLLGGGPGAATGALIANRDAVQAAVPYALGGLAAASGGAALGGYNLAGMVDKAPDPDELKQQELADAYRQQAAYLKGQAELQRAHQARQAGRRFRAPSLH